MNKKVGYPAELSVYRKPLLCPDWSSKPTPAENVHISAGVVRVYLSTLKIARNFLPDHGTLKTWHQMLFSKVVPIPYYAGNFRRLDIARECLGRDVQIGGLAGSPFSVVEAEMAQFAEDLRARAFELENHLALESRPHYQVLAKISLIAWAMVRFIQVHPFLNGNGRVARLLVNYLCYRYELPLPFFDPSNRPSEHEYGIAGRAAMNGDAKPTFRYILAAISGRL